MNKPTLNLNGLAIVIADPNSYLRQIIHSMLLGFGASKPTEVEDSIGAVEVLTTRKIDVLLCDLTLPPQGGLSLTRAIRRNADNENRTVPILLMTGDSREATIKAARDAGANMVVAKPMSPKTLYQRLAWIAFNPRNFVDTATYFGPDRRFKVEGYPDGLGRRKGDKAVEVAEEEVGPALAQDDIDNPFGTARSGQS
jgi:two-component system, chemotaxis family, chemotaxis protein CheY